MALFRSFLVEQSDPDRFYSAVANDTITLMTRHESLAGKRVLDVGAGQEQFGPRFVGEDASYVAVDIEREPLHPDAGIGGVVGRGEDLPFANDSFDVVMSNNVLEHVRAPEAIGDEMVRVVRPGGLIFISYTVWASPWGGHETSPWHLLGGHYARRRYQRKQGRPPKNRFGETMHATSAAQGLRWAKSHPDADLIEAAPRYHPDWADSVLVVPGLRELVTWNLLLVLRRKESGTHAHAPGGRSAEPA